MAKVRVLIVSALAVRLASAARITVGTAGSRDARSAAASSNAVVSTQKKGTSGCFPFNGGCEMAGMLCGGDPLVDFEMSPKNGNKCAELVYYVTLGYNHCLEKELDRFKDCYFQWLQDRVPPSWECEKVCADSQVPAHECVPHCERFHTCTDRCTSETYRDNIRMCFGDCIELSPYHPDGTCSENCGGHAPNGKCSCDFSCQSLGDCCSDFLNYCVAPHLKVLPAPGEKTFFDSSEFANVVNNTNAVNQVEENPGGEETGTTRAQDPAGLANAITQKQEAEAAAVATAEKSDEEGESSDAAPAEQKAFSLRQKQQRGLALRGGGTVVA